MGSLGASAFAGAGAAAGTLGGMGSAFALGADVAASPFVGSLAAAGLTPNSFYYPRPAPGGIGNAAVSAGLMATPTVYDHFAQGEASAQLLGLATDTYNVTTPATDRDREREAHSLATASA